MSEVYDNTARYEDERPDDDNVPHHLAYLSVPLHLWEHSHPASNHICPCDILTFTIFMLTTVFSHIPRSNLVGSKQASQYKKPAKEKPSPGTRSRFSPGTG